MLKKIPVALAISQEPMTRTQCVLEDLTDKKRSPVHVEWDPSNIRGLERHVDLPTMADPLADVLKEWKLSCTAEPLLLTAGSTMYMLRFRPFRDNDAATHPGCAAPQSAGEVVLVPATITSSPKDQPVAADPVECITITFKGASSRKPSRLMTIASAPQPPGGRSLDSASGIATELVTILTEVAADKAKAGAFNLVAEEVRHAVCEDLIVTDSLARNPSLQKGQPLLPRTCEALKKLRLADLSSSATVLAPELFDDLLRLALLDVKGRTKLDPAAVAQLVSEALRGYHAPDRAAQQIFQGLANREIIWDGANQAEMDLQIVFATVQACTEKEGGCKAADVEQMLRHAGELFITEEGQEIKPEWFDRAFTLAPLVLKGLEVVQPRSDATPKSIAVVTIDLFFEMENRLQGCNDSKKVCDNDSKKVCDELDDLRGMSVGILNGESHRALVSGAKLVEAMLEKDLEARNGRAVKLIMNVMGTLTAYASTYASNPKDDAEKLKALHQARKEAIEGLVTALTDRRGRGGAVIVSLGVDPGVIGGVHWQQTADNYKTLHGSIPVVTLPMGLAVEKLPASQEHIGCGGHFQLSVLDLAQFLSVNNDGTVSKPTWASAFMAGVEAKVLIGKPSGAIGIGADVRYSPGLFATSNDLTKSGGDFRLGLSVSYYVPFIDFN
ncbi:hypothetical protein A7982_13320 [Minicystis rosea]|nr:hypothetical protein A7982_13320 [Minicystis rosea]